jgi:hypothetical protein
MLTRRREERSAMNASGLSTPTINSDLQAHLESTMKEFNDERDA